MTVSALSAEYEDLIDDSLRKLRPKLEQACPSWGPSCRWALLCPPKPVEDDVRKALLRDATGNPVAVLLLSAPSSPGLVARGMDTARSIQTSLGTDLGRVILTPLECGWVDGLSYSVLPYCRPLSASRPGWFVQRRRLGPQILRWLRSAASATRTTVPVCEVGNHLATPLDFMISDDALPVQARDRSREALSRLAAGEWHPVYVLVHNDLWKGNLLLSSASSSRGGGHSRYEFVLIDWLGARVHGHAIYDLIRFAMSMSISPKKLGQEVRRHCEVLNCETKDAMGYLMAGLGWLGMHREAFPLGRYRALVNTCVSLLAEAERFR